MISTTLSTNTSVEATARADKAAFIVAGTWDGATVVFEVQTRGGDTWVPITGASWTADATGVLDMSRHWKVRVTSSSVGTTSINVSLEATTA